MAFVPRSGGIDGPAVQAPGVRRRSLVGRAAAATGVGLLVLVGWSAAAHAEAGPDPTDATAVEQPSAPTRPGDEPGDEAPTSLRSEDGSVIDAVTSPVGPAATRTAEAIAPVIGTAGATSEALVPGVVPLAEAAGPVTAPVLDGAVAPVLDGAVTPVIDAAVTPVIDAAAPVIDAVGSITAPAVEPLSDTLIAGLDVLPVAAPTDAATDLLVPGPGPLLAPPTPAAGQDSVLTAPADRAPAMGQTGSAGFRTDTVVGAIIHPGTAPAAALTGVASSIDRLAAAAPGDGADRAGHLPRSPRPDDGLCRPGTSAAGSALVLLTVEGSRDLAARSRRVSARPLVAATPPLGPAARPAFAPD